MVVDRSIRRRKVDPSDSTKVGDNDDWNKTSDKMKDTLEKADLRSLEQKKADLKESLQKSQAKKLSDRARAKAREKIKSSKSSSGAFCSCVAFIGVLITGTVICMAVINIPIDPVSFRLPLPPQFKDGLTRNNILQYTQHILENEVIGPESLAVNKETGAIYTGTYDGKIVEINQGSMRTITELGKAPCGKPSYEEHCGRPLGIRIDKDGDLVVADAYLGLFKVNPKTGEHKTLLSSSTKIDGVKPTFLNDLDIAKDGTIYVSDSSSKWQRKDVHLMILEGGTDGRVLWYEPSTNTSGVLVDGLCFPNGIQLSPSGNFLYIAETTRARIRQYHLSGPLKGQLHVFSANLPGLPDNIRPSESGGYWVALALTRMSEKLSVFDLTAPYPWMRNIVSKLMSYEVFLKTVSKLSYGLVVELDRNGKIVQSYHDPSGLFVPSVSEVAENNGTLYLGSYYLPQLGVIDVRKYEKLRHL